MKKYALWFVAFIIVAAIALWWGCPGGVPEPKLPPVAELEITEHVQMLSSETYYRFDASASKGTRPLSFTWSISPNSGYTMSSSWSSALAAGEVWEGDGASISGEKAGWFTVTVVVRNAYGSDTAVERMQCIRHREEYACPP